ncbi:MAG TPA: DUF222 domain-containing protein [Acidimicrobiales bacterium]|nr:DUF222 domain-containing protein [Acidimicrobiales bacterium]
MFWTVIDPAALEDDDLTQHLAALERAQREIDAARAAAIAEWDRRQVWADDGSAAAASRLARETGIAGSTARERVRVTRKLSDMPATRDALHAHRIGWSKARLLAAACNDRTAEAFARDEATLVEQACRFTVDQLEVFLRNWRRLVDPDGANADADAMHERQFVQLDESWAGEGFLRGRLSPEAFAIVKSVLDRLADEIYRAERAERKALEAAGADDPTGDAPASLEPRIATRSERLAEALVEMARRASANTDAAASGARVSPASPLLLLTMNVDRYRDLLTQTGSGTPLAGATATRLACDAAIARVLSSAEGEPVDLGRTSRLPSPAQRRALATQWTGCAFPGCDRPFAWCQIHHVHHWTAGGPTDLDNLLPLCSRHHHLQHQGVFGIERSDDGFRFTRADGRPIGPANPTVPKLLAALGDLARAA